VKSAYHLFMSVYNPDIARGSGTGAEGDEWNRIWVLSVLPKIKQFICMEISS
jgi:hypothetical protein